MRSGYWRAAGVLLCLAGSAFTADSASAQPQTRGGQACIPFRDLEHINRLGPTSALATTQRDSYEIGFRNNCSAASAAAFFIFNRNALGTCLGVGDVLQTSEHIDCTVEKVSLRPRAPADKPVPDKNGQK